MRLISIIIPVYQVEEYILDCLSSVSSQDYSNIECLLINDCTPDKSIELAKTFITNYKGSIQFRIINRQQNGGLSEARNTGIIEAKGEYIYFLDSDDTIAASAISSLEKLSQNGSIDMVCAYHTHEKDSLSKTSNNTKKYFGQERFNAFNRFNNAWNKLIRTSIIIDNNLFFQKGIYHEDRLWTFQTILQIKSLCWTEAQFYFYRIRNNSIMTAVEKREKRILDSIFIVHKMQQSYKVFGKKNKLDRRIFNYIERERFGVCVAGQKFSNEILSKCYKELNPNYSLSTFLQLNKENQFKNICWLLPTLFGKMYFKILYNIRYSKY